ncbi:YceI family protein [Streptomyces sp. KL116D]|uniref:YceI family protein n=1 Tax=Streptomyces sp. KL116D TaxID=3045152 RepID=UPI0035563D40
MLQNRTTSALTGFYVIDQVHSRVGFTVRHVMGSQLHGAFGGFEGLLVLDAHRPALSEAFLTVQTESLDTGLGERDAHLTGPAVLGCPAFPTMTFHSTGVTPLDGGGHHLAGRLKIKNVERPLALHVTPGGARTDSLGLTWVGFEATATLDLADWGLTVDGARTGGPGTCADVSLHLSVSAVQVFHRPLPSAPTAPTAPSIV